MLQTLGSIEKTTNDKTLKSSKVNFRPKSNMRNIAYTKPLNLGLSHNWLALYLQQRLETRFEVIENVKKLKFRGD